jgi:REP element-mobilizing transposase RayT
MSEKYKFYDPAGMYFVTMSTMGWVDLFTRTELKHVIIDSLRYCQKEKGLVIHAWYLMPSHLHLIISSEDSLSDIIRDFKKHTSKELVKTMEHIHESRKGCLPAGQAWILDLFIEVPRWRAFATRCRSYQICILLAALLFLVHVREVQVL